MYNTYGVGKRRDRRVLMSAAVLRNKAHSSRPFHRWPARNRPGGARPNVDAPLHILLAGAASARAGEKTFAGKPGSSGRPVSSSARLRAQLYALTMP